MPSRSHDAPELTIRNARIVTPDGIVAGDLAITGGSISHIGGRLAPGGNR